MAEKKHVLLIEDNILDVQLTQEAFAEVAENIDLHVARGGQEAFDYLFGLGACADRNIYPLPDIILLDLKMPDIGGLDILRKVKNTTHLKRIPIIILTSSKERKDLEESYDSGANSYLVKPVSYSAFVEMIKALDTYWFSFNVPTFETKETDSKG